MASIQTSASRDYEEVKFAGKADQMRDVSAVIRERKLIPDDRVDQEVAWFYKYGRPRSPLDGTARGSAALTLGSPLVAYAGGLCGRASATSALTSCTFSSKTRT